MKILSIGNSFSVDAHSWLHSVSECGDTRVDTVNLAIGGCSLERHYNNIINDIPDYEYWENGLEASGKCSVKKVLESDSFDAVTVQQVSGASGQPQTYFPYLPFITAYIRDRQPQAQLYFHETWSYEIDSTHRNFVRYNSDQKEMFRRICDCAQMACEVCDLKMIPAGDFIQYLRENTTEFDYKNGGISLNRDGFHLSLDYGRFAAAALWYETLTKKTARADLFAEKHPEFDAGILTVIADALKDFMDERSER